jgi:hypothetical protein
MDPEQQTDNPWADFASQGAGAACTKCAIMLGMEPGTAVLVTVLLIQIVQLATRLHNNRKAQAHLQAALSAATVPPALVRLEIPVVPVAAPVPPGPPGPQGPSQGPQP